MLNLEQIEAEKIYVVDKDFNIYRDYNDFFDYQLYKKYDDKLFIYTDTKTLDDLIQEYKLQEMLGEDIFKKKQAE